ncbi:AraC family transcriptional regulator [Reyranella aquatilis]|uniref:AraC family transcriptional regulator n=1 Tax=Reyranella aquatilis TaxID=2035356 RepID=A0ABS8KWK4_9HYPH|nr:AraC family transcriptional regulator [Reyranella aquatilis]MCC8430438.1 AraC family transcriptional regulator [Reyranella aquatilis]
MNDTLLLSLDWMLRGGTIALVLLIAGTLLRDFGGILSARLGALFALGTATYALSSAAGFQAFGGWWAFPALALSAGNNTVFWLFASSLFDDGFRLRPWHAGLWLLLVGAGLAECFLAGPRDSAFGHALGIGLTLSSFAFAVLAVARTLSTWQADLVEGRRRLRLFVVVGSSAYIGLMALSQLFGAVRAAPERASLVAAVALLAIAASVAWSLLRPGAARSLFVGIPAADRPAEPARVPEATPSAARSGEPPQAEPVDGGLLASLEHAMTVERTYRQDGLTIAALGQKLGLPEHRLRRLINQGLGYRNFNSFLNHYRIAEVKAALADPGQAEVAVLTIALDAGFSSLGPFNRAFKAETGLTPTDYRRLHGGKSQQTVADSGIGQPPFGFGAKDSPASLGS